MFAILVASMTAIVAGLFVAWLLNPALRRRLELPKYRMLEQERRFAGNQPRAGGPP